MSVFLLWDSMSPKRKEILTYYDKQMKILVNSSDRPGLNMLICDLRKPLRPAYGAEVCIPACLINDNQVIAKRIVMILGSLFQNSLQ